MKNQLFALLLSTVVLAACQNNPEPNHGNWVEILSIEPQHSTRSTLIVRYEDGYVGTAGVHSSWVIDCGKEKLVIGDFHSGRRPYGKLNLPCNLAEKR